MAFANGSFFLGNTDAVLSFRTPKVNSKLPSWSKKSPTFPVAATPTLDAMSLSHRMGKVVRLGWFTIKRG